MDFVNKKFSNTAILIFAHSETLESTLKPIVYTSKKNKSLWRVLNNRVVKTTKKTNLPYFIFDEHHQLGNTFGEKITHSIQSVFEKGFEKVIVIGNDCIELDSNLLTLAIQNLQYNETVLGPDLAGGTYLIGVSKSSFNPSDFSKIDWQTNRVFLSLKKLNIALQIAILPALSDCNNTIDFETILKKLPFNAVLKSILQRFSKYYKTPYYSKTTCVQNTIFSIYFGRGSPIFLS